MPKKEVEMIHSNLNQETLNKRIGARRFIAQNCELAKLLPPRKKVLFLMRFSSGFSYEEIAKICNVDEVTVSRQIKKIADELAEMRKCCD